MDKESVTDSATPLSGSRCSTAVLLIQSRKKAQTLDSLTPVIGLELSVVPQLVLANKGGRIVVSPAKKKKKKIEGGRSG